MRDNVCIFQKVVHDNSGAELPQALLLDGAYVESIELDGPKLMLVYADPGNYLKSSLKIREYDTLTVSYGDPWREGGISEKENFTALSCSPGSNGDMRLNLMATPVYELKKITSTPRVFAKRGILDIAKALAKGVKFSFDTFPVVEDYHNLPGERPTSTLRQIAKEQGGHIWYCRGTMRMRKFASMFAEPPAMTFNWNGATAENCIIRYKKPSSQVRDQENSARKFTGWNEVKGRVNTSPDNPVLKKAASKPASMNSSPDTFVLGNAVCAKQTAIDFVALGNMSVTAGQALKLVWKSNDPANPFIEGLPDKVVVEAVSHWYSNQKYYMRVKGAIAVEPF